MHASTPPRPSRYATPAAAGQSSAGATLPMVFLAKLLVQIFLWRPGLRRRMPAKGAHRIWRTIAICLLWGGVAHAQTASPLYLSDTQGRIPAWQAAKLLIDPSGTLSAEDALQQLDLFQSPPKGATLGVRRDAVWLHIPMQVAPDSKGDWVLDINHPDLRRIDVLLLQNHTVLQRGLLGTSVPQAERLLRGRTPALPLMLAPGQRYDLLLRVQTQGAMILPITLNTPSAMLSAAIDEQMLQGVLTGIALCLIFYSLAQWLSLREPLFAQYALLTTGSMLYSLHFFGVGQQYLWGNSPWLVHHTVGLASLMALTGCFLFMGQALEGQNPQSRFLRTMRWCAAATAALALAHALGLIPLKAVAIIVSVLGPMPTILSAPRAWRRARACDSVGTTLLIAWLVYALGAGVAIGMINGSIPVNFWSQHAFQIAATLDMLLFMRVLGLRSKALHTQAQLASEELNAMHSLAHTDPLTGLPNRRGLQMALSSALSRVGPESLLAVYMMDLDGFKPVNDQHGHDVGDELLVAVTKRLQGHLRQTDVIARLGGDEFVVMTGQLQNPVQAHDLGLKLLEAFHAPFSLGCIQVQVGLTIGYAIAPNDSQDAAGLLKLADAAMYSGKQSGKFCVRRNTGDLALSSV